MRRLDRAVRLATTAAAVGAAGAVAAVGARAGGRYLVGRTERRLCVTTVAPPYPASDRARSLQTAAGRAMIERMEARGMVVDVAHASSATIDDVLATATRPIVASHTGVRGTADNARNLSDAHVRGIAATGGVVGIGFWDTATGGDDVAAIARSIAYAVGVAGVEHVGLGSDFDGGVRVPIDATGLVQITDALLALGFSDDAIARVMGGNALRVLAGVLPD